MTTLATLLNGSTVIAASTAPTLGNINTYNASGGALTPALPALSGQNVGASCIVEKYALDTTLNTVTFTAAGSDTFDDTSTSFAIFVPGEKVNLQVISISGTKYWKAISATHHKNGLAAATAQFALSNSSSATDITGSSATLPAGKLAAGSTFRVKLFGTVKVKATSGTLTFTPFIQGTALNTIQMATQTSAEGPVGFWAEILITVRTTGSSGTAIAHGSGRIKFATNTAVDLTSTNTSATTVNTTAAAGSNVLKVQATFATADANNALALEIVTVERVL